MSSSDSPMTLPVHQGPARSPDVDGVRFRWWRLLVVGVLTLVFLVYGGRGIWSLHTAGSAGCGSSSQLLDGHYFTPISSSPQAPPYDYKLFLFHIGEEAGITGVPVLFIHGNAGGHRQVRHLAAASYQAYVQGHYPRRLDWFAVDFNEDQPAWDTQTIVQQSGFVVYAINRILELYNESFNVQSNNIPRSVILVCHSMGGFVARAATVNPHLRKEMVETILTLSSPHRSPPFVIQPSMGGYYSYINAEWRKGYKKASSLSHVIVVSISAGVRDIQIRSKYESLDGIVPSSHGIVIGSSSMRNVWSAMDHEAILMCSQLIAQVSHTLLKLMDPRSGLPFSSRQERLTIFSDMLKSEIPLNGQLSSASGSVTHTISSCLEPLHWNSTYIDINRSIFAVHVMDGRQRLLDIQKLSSNGKNYFVFVTNLVPCFGVRLHLWTEKPNMTSDATPSKTGVEVTSKIVEIPAGLIPTQDKLGDSVSPPSKVLVLGPSEMHQFRYLTVSIGLPTSVLGRPPQAASMALGQFFSPENVKRNFSPWFLRQEILIEEDHPLLLNLSFSESLGLLPATISLQSRCKTKGYGLLTSDAGHIEHNSHCKLGCFPSVAIVWDPTSGMHVISNLSSETIIVDSAPAYWDSTQESDRTTVSLLVDPHCSFKISATISLPDAAGRFLVLYYSQIICFSIAVIFFALMRQAYSWEREQSLPSVLDAIEMNLRLKVLLIVVVVPFVIALAISLSWQLPPVWSFFVVSMICYGLSNLVVILILFVQLIIFYSVARLCVKNKIRWQVRFTNGLLGLKVSLVLLLVLLLLAFIHPVCSLVILTFFLWVDSVSSLSSTIDRSSNVRRQRNTTREYNEERQHFNHHLGVFMLHALVFLMFVPSTFAWLKRTGNSWSMPWDVAICFGAILHGGYGITPFPRRQILGWPVGMSVVYLVAGYYCFMSGFALAPYKALYPAAIVGLVSSIWRICEVVATGERNGTWYKGMITWCQKLRNIREPQHLALA